MKKNILISLVLLLMVTAVNAQQTAKWDSTYRPGSYKLKVTQFATYHHSPTDIVFLGNSITEHPEWNELLQLPQARNRGISGDITFGVLQRLNEVIEGKPSKLFIMIGINDISRNIPDEIIIANYKKIVLRVRDGSPRTKIYIQSILPVNSSFGKFKNHYNKDEHIDTVNKALIKLAKDEGAVYIDLRPAFTNAEGRLMADYTDDGLHPNAKGYLKWAEILKDGNYLDH